MDNVSPSTESILNEIQGGNVGLALLGIHTRMEQSQYFSQNEIEDLSVELNKQADSVEKADALNTLNNQHQIHKRNKNLEDTNNQNNN